MANLEQTAQQWGDRLGNQWFGPTQLAPNVRLAGYDNGVLLEVTLPSGEAAVWTVADGPSADKFLASPP